MTAHQDRPYPFAPLDEVLVGQDVTVVLRVSATTLRRYREFGLTEDQADRLAVRAGWPAASLWPEIIDAAIADLRTCAAIGCEETFVPVRRDQRYHSRPCASRGDERTQERKNRWQSARYQSDPEFRAKRVRGSATYYEENGDYVRARQRRADRERRALAAERRDRRAVRQVNEPTAEARRSRPSTPVEEVA